MSTPPRPWQRPRILLTLLAAAVVVIVALVITLATMRNKYDNPLQGLPPLPSESPYGVLASGTVSLKRGAWEAFPGSELCEGKGAYEGVAVGALLVIQDETAKDLGSVQLGDSHVEGDLCVFPFKDVFVPELSIYQVKVADREPVTAQRSELGALKLTFG